MRVKHMKALDLKFFALKKNSIGNGFYMDDYVYRLDV